MNQELQKVLELFCHQREYRYDIDKYGRYVFTRPDMVYDKDVDRVRPELTIHLDSVVDNERVVTAESLLNGLLSVHEHFAKSQVARDTKQAINIKKEQFHAKARMD